MCLPKVVSGFCRLIENITFGRAAIGYRAESMHGAGSPQAQRIMIARQVDFDLEEGACQDLGQDIGLSHLVRGQASMRALFFTFERS